MKRLLSALALAAALMLPAATTPGFASSCTSQVIGSTTYTSCTGDDGSYSNGTSQRIGNIDYHSAYGSDGSYSTGTTQHIGNSAYTDWTTLP